MVIVTVSLNPKEAFKKAYLAHMQELREIVLTEEGCMTYELFEDPYHATKLFMFEKWENQEALDKHLLQPHMLEHFQKVAPWVDEKAVIEIHEVSKSKSL